MKYGCIGIIFILVFSSINLNDIKPIKAQQVLEDYINLSLSKEFGFRGGKFRITYISSYSNIKLAIINPSGIAVYNKTVYPNATSVISIINSAEYGTYIIRCTKNDMVVESWFSVISNDGWGSVSMPYSWTHNNMNFSFYGNYTVIITDDIGSKMSVDFTTFRDLNNLFDMDVNIYKNNNFFLVRASKGSYMYDLSFLFYHRGVKWSWNGTLDKPRNVIVKVSGQRLKKLKDDLISGNLIQSIKDIRVSGISFDYNNGVLNMSVSESFYIDPVIFSSDFESGSFAGDGWSWTSNDAGSTVVLNVTANNGVMFNAYMAQHIINADDFASWGYAVKVISASLDVVYIGINLGLNETINYSGYSFGHWRVIEIYDSVAPTEKLEVGIDSFNSTHWNLVWGSGAGAGNNYSSTYYPWASLLNRRTFIEFKINCTDETNTTLDIWVNGTLVLSSYRDIPDWNEGIKSFRMGNRYSMYTNLGNTFQLYWDNVTIANTSIGYGAPIIPPPPPPPFTLNEGYGEDEQRLGQFVDTFVDLNYTSVRFQVERNATLNAMELNYTTVAGSEDFTTYTEVDEDGDITITVPKVDWVTMRRDAETYVWKDFSPSYFGDFEFQYELNISDVEAGDSTSASIMAICLSNVTGVMDDIQGGSVLMVALQQNGAVDDDYGFYIRQFDGGVSKFLEGNTLNYHDVSEGEIYHTFSRVGTNVTLWVYSDSARTTLLYKYSSNLAVEDTYKYVQISNWGRDVDAGNHHTGYIEYLWVGSLVSGYVSEGYFTTTDYLSNILTNGLTLVQMTNTSIPPNTVITVEFSDDNATWILNDWQPIFGGFESIDLRDLNYSTNYYIRYNLSTTDSTVTPRIYQSRLITTIGNSTCGGVAVSGGINSSTILMLILLSIMALLIYWGIKRK